MKIGFFQNMSIMKKLTLIITGVSAFTIVFGLIIYSVFDILNYKKDMQNNISLHAKLVGEYCSAALTFGYKDEAESIISELDKIPGLTLAGIYDDEGKLFAYFSGKAAENKIALESDNLNSGYSGDYLNVFQPIIHDGEKIGSVYLQVKTTYIDDKIVNILVAGIFRILLLSAPVYILSSRLQRLISNPILKLAEITTNYSETKSNLIEIENDRKDEIGILYFQFNEMLKRINKATSDLRGLNEELEERVAQRTSELEKSNEELKKVEKARRDSEQRLRDILDHAPILIYINDLEGNYTFVNKEFERLMELSIDDVINKTDYDLFPSQRAERNIKQNKKVIESRSVQMFENSSIKKGVEHYFVDILFPITDINGEIYATSGWTIDISDRKRSEDALMKAKELAESADRLKSAFLATMSHELRTPLNSIIGFTGILLKELAGPLNSEQTKQLNMIQGSGKHLLDLINDVLDISKIEAGELVVTFDWFDFNKLLNKIISVVRPLAEKKEIELELKISPKIELVFSDVKRVEQIFLNLVNNAIKFTDSGLVEVDCEIKDDKIITRITDTGIGIKDEDLSKLFKPFSQIDTGTSRNHEGTGLGLSICKKLIDKLNGEISVQSKLGVGSIFTVILPIDEENKNA